MVHSKIIENESAFYRDRLSQDIMN